MEGGQTIPLIHSGLRLDKNPELWIALYLRRCNLSIIWFTLLSIFRLLSYFTLIPLYNCSNFYLLKNSLNWRLIINFVLIKKDCIYLRSIVDSRQYTVERVSLSTRQTDTLK